MLYYKYDFLNRHVSLPDCYFIAPKWSVATSFAKGENGSIQAGFEAQSIYLKSLFS